jgi:UDP-N-acetylmuramate--alanine ligase
MGIGGTGMSSLAHYLLDHGMIVHGSDRSANGYSQSLEQLAQRGVTLYPQDGSAPALFHRFCLSHGAVESNICFVRSKAVEDHVADVVQTRFLGFEPIFRSDLLASLFNSSKKGIAIAGTAGKSTVTGMATHIFRRCGEDPASISGAPLHGFPSGHGGMGPLIIEADESDLSLIAYKPKIAVLLNLLRDHHENHIVEKAFQTFAGNLLPEGTLVFNASCPLSLRIAAFTAESRPDLNLIAFSPIPSSDSPSDSPTHSSTDLPTGLPADLPDTIADKCVILRASNPSRENWQSHFGISIDFPAGFPGVSPADANPPSNQKSTFQLELSIPCPGDYQISNTCAALAAAIAWGVNPENAAAAMADYPGIFRRFQHFGTLNGIDLVDDFAHHPSEIRAALSTALELTPPQSRVHAVYQPHGYGPTRFTFDEMVETLTKMDKRVNFWLTEIFYGGGTVNKDISSAHIIDAVAKTGESEAENIKLSADFENLATEIATKCQKGDLVLIMGARDINRLTPMIARNINSQIETNHIMTNQD